MGLTSSPGRILFKHRIALHTKAVVTLQLLRGETRIKQPNVTTVPFTFTKTVEIHFKPPVPYYNKDPFKCYILVKAMWHMHLFHIGLSATKGILFSGLEICQISIIHQQYSNRQCKISLCNCRVWNSMHCSLPHLCICKKQVLFTSHIQTDLPEAMEKEPNFDECPL